MAFFFGVEVLALFFHTTAQAADYDLVIGKVTVYVTGAPVAAMGINGTIPGPVLRFTEGEEVTLRVTNRLDEDTSIHWHGFLIQPEMDGVPGFNRFHGIKPGETFVYRFKVRQSGTYWYHSHSGLQEQAGVYGPIVISPAAGEPVKADRDYVVMLSDFTPEPPMRVLRNLKADSGYYNFSKRTLGDFFADIAHDGLSKTLGDRLAWGDMRMDPTDIADVSGYTFLVNGKPPRDNETFLFKPGERVRLRFINGSAMTYFDVRIPGLKMIVISADGQNVQPVPVDEFRIAVAETYDVIVTPKDDKPFTIFAESIDRTGYARATLAPHPGLEGEIPEMRPRTVLTMADMGMAHGGMSGMNHDSMQDMSSMDHGSMGGMPGMNHKGMTGMDHGKINSDPGAGMDHGAMGQDAMKAEVEGDARPRGWADASTPPGMKALSYADLKSLTPQKDVREPGREVVVRLGGNMERFIWTINGEKFENTEPIQLKYGERVKLTFVNETMMAHPMHLHGMFVELVNGQPGERLPKKHVVNVAPGQSYSVLLTADESGEWAFHCHLLYHMAAGMMTKVVVAELQTADARP